jgi:hypothetical protein
LITNGAGREVEVGAPALSGDFGMISFLDAFVKLRKATISFRHVCLSVRAEQFGSHWKDFHEI